LPMEKVRRDILERIDALLSEDESRGRRIARDFLENLAGEMEKLAQKKLELERKIARASSAGGRRSALVEEMASLLEENAGRARLTRQLMDGIIERLYGLNIDAAALLEREPGDWK